MFQEFDGRAPLCPAQVPRCAYVASTVTDLPYFASKASHSVFAGPESPALGGRQELPFDVESEILCLRGMPGLLKLERQLMFPACFSVLQFQHVWFR